MELAVLWRLSEVVLAVLKINRKTFLNENEIIWKAICFKVCLLYCQLESAHLFLPIIFSLCLSFSFWGRKMVIWKVSSARFGWLWRLIEREQIVDSYLQADSLDLAQYSVEMLGWRLFFPPNFLIEFWYTSSLIWEHEDLQENWKGRQLMDNKTCISMWYVTGLWSSLQQDKKLKLDEGL